MAVAPNIARLRHLLKNFTVAVATITTGTINNLTTTKKSTCVTAGSYGLYEAVYEVDFGGITPTATDNGLIATVCTIPDNCRVTAVHVVCTEAFSNNSTRAVDVVTTAAAAASNDAITADVELVANASLASGAKGAVDARVSGVFSGTTAAFVQDTSEQKIVVINKGTGNDTTALTSGKLLFYIQYVGNGSSTALTTVRGS
jgi:hypothetical protein